MPVTQHDWLVRLALAALVAVLLLSIDKLHLSIDNTPAISEVPQVQDPQPYSNITKRDFVLCDWSDANVIDDEETATECQRRARLGSWLVCMLKAPDPGTGEGAWPPQSKWTDPEDMYDLGWTTEWTGNVDLDHVSGVYGALSAIGADHAAKDAWYEFYQGHDFNTPPDEDDEDCEYPHTGAMYESTVSFEYGVVVAHNNWSPEYRSKTFLPEELPPSRLVPLKQWSDLAFLGLSKHPDGNKHDLEHYFRYNIVNEDSTDVIRMVVGMEFLDPTRSLKYPRPGTLLWPGLEFTMDKPQAKALLSTPNARGIAWLYGQHKDDNTGFGVRTVDRINVFNCESVYYAKLEARWCLYLHITNAS